MIEITQSILKELLDYNPETGVFTWKVYRNHLAKAGDRAGTLNTAKYIQIKINRKLYSANRLAWIYMTGEFPNHNIIHSNDIRHDNRWCNLHSPYYGKLTQDRLKQLLNYCPDTGIFTNIRRRLGITYGSIAKSECSEGYIMISVDRKRYKAHRLAWLYMTGEWPLNLVDHADNVRDNNQWSNLRQATNSQNCQNQKKKTTNSSGLKGVSKCKKTSMYHASICVNNKQIFLGSFVSKYKAYEAYCEAAKIHHGEFYNLG